MSDPPTNPALLTYSIYGQFSMRYFMLVPETGSEPTIFRPRTCDIEATVGWIIVEAKRNPVPDQNASKALPPSSALMMGNAVGRLVESMATAAMIVNSDMNARRNRLVGFQPSLLPEPLAAASPTVGATTGA